jgi:hypothetical protein
MKESRLESKACRFVKQCGGLALKWVSPGWTGVPDRIMILPKGKIIFVEFKKPGTADGLSPRQKKAHLELSKRGCQVWRISDFEDFVERLHTYGI